MLARTSIAIAMVSTTPTAGAHESARVHDSRYDVVVSAGRQHVRAAFLSATLPRPDGSSVIVDTRGSWATAVLRVTRHAPITVSLARRANGVRIEADLASGTVQRLGAASRVGVRRWRIDGTALAPTVRGLGITVRYPDGEYLFHVTARTAHARAVPRFTG